MSDPTVTPELIDHLRDLAPAELVQLPDGNRAVRLPTGSKLESIKTLMAEYAPAPDRKRGTATTTRLDSFITLTNRGKDGSSVLFARAEPPALLAVLNYNVASAGPPRFGDHRVLYEFPVSVAWAKWTAGDSKPMSQQQFAEFLEDRIVDVVEPPNLSARQKGDEIDAHLELQTKLGGKFAGPSTLLALSRGMSVNVNMRVSEAVVLESGETQVNFAEQHADKRGAPLKVPTLFAIVVPIFDRGKGYRIAVRLRYRVSGGAVSWFYTLYEPTVSFDHAFDEACDKAKAETNLPLYHGKPE